MQNISFGAHIFWGGQKMKTRGCFDLLFFSLYSVIFRCTCLHGLLCMEVTLNIIFEGYTSYSIMYNHIQSYLNHIQK